MNILLTGDKGYIGSILAPRLLAAGHQVRGFDIGFFDDCLLWPTNDNYPQIAKDIRDIERADVEGVDAIVHLAGLSNDPLGDLSSKLTEEINLGGTLRLAEISKHLGIKRFVYASSQSMYGISESGNELDEDTSQKNPVTAYARTKWEAECELTKMNDNNFQVVSFRPSTVFGMSPRLRCDIVYNNLVGCAYTTGAIEVKSDGTPWRPVVHINDVCSAFMTGLLAPSNLVAGRAFNVGIPNGNFSVRDLAESAQRVVPGSGLNFTGEHGSDSRTYRVSFQRILKELDGLYAPEWSLDRGGKELVAFFKKCELAEESFRGPVCNRLQKITKLISEEKLDDQLRLI
jgi:nucleoside-diphosphate-sugar epimerase